MGMLAARFVGLLVFVMLAVGVGEVAAAPPHFLSQIPERQASPGGGAGELDHPRGVAAEAEAGHVYFADRRNFRVSEYTAWGLFVKAWGWGVADGSAELQTCGPVAPEAEPDPSLCRTGTPGIGKGQMALLVGGMAVDGEGNVWVADLENLRIQKFSPEGQFLLMLGGDVNKTKVEEGAPAMQRNVCPVVPTDACQAGVPGGDPSQLSEILFDAIAFDPAAKRILVGDKGGIQVFDLEGNWVKTIAFSGLLGAFAGETVNALDIDKDGNVYFSLSGGEDIVKLDATGAPAEPGKPGESKFRVGNPFGVALDLDGSVYAIDDPVGTASALEGRVLKFNAAGSKLFPTQAEEDAGAFFPFVSFGGPSITAIATNLCEGSEGPGSLYAAYFQDPTVSKVDAFGTAPIGCESPPIIPPETVAQFAGSVGSDWATVKAQINPRFWPDATYYVEYGTGKCSDLGGCPNKAPVPPALLTGKSINAPVGTSKVFLEGLALATTYHYRFVVESGGGGPVFGIDPDGREGSAEASEAKGLEATFRTFGPAKDSEPCPNDAVRRGESAKLPDCRAYEVVSPLDKGGGDVALWDGRRGQSAQEIEINQSAPSGGRFTFTSEFAFAEPESGALFSQYMSTRDDAGWGSEAISPPRTEAAAIDFLDNDFRGFSENLCQGWPRLFSIAPLTIDAIEEFPNLYRRENCEEPPFLEALTTTEPPNRSPSDYELELQGFSGDGAHALFSANDVLVAGAPLFADRHELTLYEHTPAGLRFVCYLPNGEPNPLPCAAGATAGGAGDTPTARNAISTDGSRIFWTSYVGTPGIGEQSGVPGQIYVRIDGTETRKVSTAVSSDPAWYWTASDDGSKVVFEFASGPHKDELYELDVGTETSTFIADEVEGPMGASEDASRIYFASKEDLDGAGPATAGGHNLYLYEASPGGGGGDFTFVMELAGGDLNGAIRTPAPIEEIPIRRSARVAQDGFHATFVSSVSPTPTGYDNLDADSGEPAQEVYLYDAVEGELRCVSCNPTGARPSGDDIGLNAIFYAAARIQGWEALNHAPRVLSSDGTRVFFESFEALVPRDTNSNWDVYQWEELGKGGIGGCTEQRETFVEESGGCVDLISSGLSSAKSTFLDADPSGDNIFFSTQSSLVKADYGLNDVYVARALGGFPEPIEEDECEGEACQSPPPPPPEVTPSTELSSGPGNEPAAKQRKARRCPKGKRRVKRAGKVRCVKRKANKTRRAQR